MRSTTGLKSLGEFHEVQVHSVRIDWFQVLQLLFANNILLLVFQIVAAMLVPIFAASPVIDGQAKPQVLRYEMDTAGMPNSYNF